MRKCGNLLQDVRFKKKNSESESGNANYFNELAIVLARLFIFSKGKNLLLDVI